MSTRVWAVGLLIIAVLAHFATDSIVGTVIAIIVAIPAVVLLLRPPPSGFYVGVADRRLLVQAIVTNKIAYQDISSVGPYIPRYSLAWMRLSNTLIAVNRVFGGSQPYLPPPGRVDASAVEVRFRRRLPVLMPIPPFVALRRGLLFRVEDSGALRELIQSKMPPVN
jgi:hypothetical protein